MGERKQTHLVPVVRASARLIGRGTRSRSDRGYRLGGGGGKALHNLRLGYHGNISLLGVAL